MLGEQRMKFDSVFEILVARKLDSEDMAKAAERDATA